MIVKFIIFILCGLGGIEVCYFAKSAFDEYIAKVASEAVNETMKNLREME